MKRALNKQTIDRMADYICSFAQNEGLQVKRMPMEKCGDFLTVEINSGAEKGCLFPAHMDTVHEKDVFGEPPVHREENKMYGPGVIDCKGGIAIALLTVKALKECGDKNHLRLLLTSDEEVSNTPGGQNELDCFTDNCAVPLRH